MTICSLHILRRQMKTDFRKPLIVFTPKSLLRHPDVVSSKKEFTEGAFQTVIEDNEVTPAKAKTLVLCTGKFYYDLVKARKEEERNDVAIVRIEQLFPLPIEAIREILSRYKDVKDVVWAQEEPRNMGVWSHLLLHLPEAVSFRPVTRRFYAAPAAGSASRSSKRHREVIEYVFDDSKDNFIRNKK
jgi:2-oxoglutarate dehydrogenase E1 component